MRARRLDEALISIAPVALGSEKSLLDGGFDPELFEHGADEAFLEARCPLVGTREWLHDR